MERPNRSAWEGGSDYFNFLVGFRSITAKGGSGGRSDGQIARVPWGENRDTAPSRVL